MQNNSVLQLEILILSGFCKGFWFCSGFASGNPHNYWVWQVLQGFCRGFARVLQGVLPN